MPKNISIFICLMVLSGCAGGKLTRIEGQTELPSDLSKDFKDKFEVKDTPPAPPSSTPEAQGFQSSLNKVPPKKKTVSKKKAHHEAGQVQGPLVYPKRRPIKDPIWVGEQHVFSITYFGMKGGDFTLDVLPHKAINERKVYHLKGTAISSPVFSLFYRLNDWVETFMDYEGLFSHRFRIVLDESKQSRDSLELYDHEKHQTFYWNRWSRPDQPFIETKEYAQIPEWTQDTLSALSYLRTIPLPNGAVITIPVTSEAKWFEAVVTVVRREMVDTVLGKVPAIVLQPEMKFQGILKKQGDSFIWLTDDDRRFVLRIEAKVKIGTIVAVLKSLQHGTAP